MPLDQFKTQVLLLHSEQRTLDSLSSGFGDRYTVHCATSGSEALNFLVETPINVIVSAQDLPGMSGLEALREAKKRSPDMIGILLAGAADSGLEALVGDEEVFQIVRGNVTGDALLELVDNATRQMRLMALAESANDTAANPDEPTEHIVMETSENGATIISDGTGRMPALDPKKVAAAASVGATAVDVLVLTKDQEFLSTVKDAARGMHTVHYATTLAQADETIRKEQVGVAVVDAAMVGDKVEQLTLHLRKGAPRLVSIVAGRRDDGEMLMDLINRGKVYRFLLKPVSPGRARLAVEASVKHHLEAPDAAFKIKADAAAPAKPAAKPAPKAAPKPVPKAKPARKAEPAEAPKPTKKTRDATTTKPVVPSDPPLGPPLGETAESPIDSALSDAFGTSESSMAETVTGLFSTISTKLKGKDKDKDKDRDKEDDEADTGPVAEPEPDSAEPAGPSLTMDESSESLLQNPKVLGLGAAAAVIVAGALFWLMSSPDESLPVEEPVISTPAISEAELAIEEPVAEEPVAEAPSVDIDALLGEARLARDAGQIFNPLGSNAIELYAAAVDAAPGNPLVQAELDAVVEQALGMAESALLEARLDDADAALRRVGLVQPGNARLPFLTAQLSQMQLRAHLDNARLAIRETRFEDASNSIAAARGLGLSDTTEIDALATDLSNARSQQQADEVLALANARLEEGDLLGPANDNARYYFELVLSNDPQNAAARQGLNVIASKLILQARGALDSGDFAAAEDLLGDVRALDPGNSELVATAAAIQAARDAEAARRQAEAQRQADAERRAAEAQAAAERKAEEERLAREAAAAKAAEEEAAAARAASEPQQAEPVADEAPAPSGAVTRAANDAVMKPDVATSVAANPVRSSASNPPPTMLAPVSSLKRTRYVSPKYPRSAQRRNLSGWVDVVFTVGMDGSVKNIDVRGSEPGEIFVNAAIKAVEKWEFEPVIENGVLVEKRAGVRMMFALE